MNVMIILALVWWEAGVQVSLRLALRSTSAAGSGPSSLCQNRSLLQSLDLGSFGSSNRSERAGLWPGEQNRLLQPDRCNLQHGSEVL